MYDYRVPDGFGDTFFQYVFDAQGAGLADGDTVYDRGVRVADGDFVFRYWSGLSTLADGLVLYDWQKNRLSSGFMRLGAGFPQVGFGQMPVIPELAYPVDSFLRFDLENVTQDVAGVDGGLTVYRSQLCFSGVRRRRGVYSDPLPSNYKFYEKPFSIPYTLTINNYASSGGEFLPPVQHRIRVEDFDFELRRVQLELESNGMPSPFKILLYDTNGVAVQNAPVLSNLFFNMPFAGAGFVSNGELNSFPSPPMLYSRGSAIQFDIYSLLFAPVPLPATYRLLFFGVRRIPC
jgi:hypothetical protein